jgi:hypothetical protein
MFYVLATNDRIVRWYAFDYTRPDAGFELLTQLDLKRVPQMDKDDAKRSAIALGLKTWRYVGLP